MAGPITWRNVGGGGSSAASFLNMGQQQIQQGLSTLSGLVKENQKADDQNFLMARDNNTNKYLDAVQAAGGVDALQNPQIRAQLEATRAGFGATIDRNVTRNAIDERVTGLQRAASVSNAYQDQQTERGQRAIVDNLYQLAATGDKAGAEKILNDNQLFDEGSIRKNITGTFDAATNRQYAAEDQARQGRAEGRAIESHAQSLQNMRESLVNSKEDRAQRNSDRDYKQNALVLDSAVKQAQDIVKTNEANNPFAGLSADPNKDATAILKDLPSGEFDSWLGFNTSDRQQMTKGVTKLLRDGVEDPDGNKVRIPPTLVTQALNNIKGKSWLTDNPMSDVETYFKDMLKDPTIRAQVEEGQQMRKHANNIVQTLGQAKTKLGSSKSLDTSGIVAELKALAGGSKIHPAVNTSANSNQPVDENTVDALSWPPKGGWSPN